MSYRMLEELQSRRKEKVATLLTFENIVGLILVGFPVFAGSAGLPFLLRVPLVAGAALLGVALTLETRGLPVYERLLWRGRGLIRAQAAGGVVRPEQLSAARAAVPARAIPVGGPVRVAHRPGAARHPAAHPDTLWRHNGRVRAE
jgi:hypothetical protein